jgi:hypothetical protein
MADISTPAPRAMKAILFGTVTACATAVIGGVLISAGNETAPYGVTMFIALPAVTGFVAGCFARFLWAALVATILSILVCFLGLLITGLEGIVCILMASPLIVAGAGIGALLGWCVRSAIDLQGSLLLFPFLGVSSLFAVGQVEERTNARERVETIVTTHIVSASPEAAWDAIVRVDHILGDKPFLLQIGLPVPTYCTLEGTGVGAKRVCHFDSGEIEEEVTEWDPPKQISVRMTRVSLPGRHWLRFESATYRFESASPGQTAITRTTTIASRLRPAWYWSQFERLGVQTEHGYLFDSLPLEKGQ